MKLIRFGEAGKEKPGVMLSTLCYDVSAHVNDYDEDFFAGDRLHMLDSWTRSHPEKCKKIGEGERFASPVFK